MSILRDRVIKEHINKNYPNSQILNYNDANCDFTFYTAEQLQQIDEDWFPLCCYIDSKTGKAVYGGRKKVFHTYTEGETGAGKTTRFVMQSILALSSLKVKPSFVIVDIHGEIIENMYNHLKQNGYQIKILNCDNPQRSDTYNPFSELARDCLSTCSIDNDAINKIRKISEIIQPIESANDPIWDRGARSYCNGCILDKFEDLIRGDIPEECLTIYNVIQNHYWLRETLSKQYGSVDLFKIPHYNKKGAKALSTQKMISVTNNAEKTRASYFGVVENHYDTFGQPSLYSLSSSNTINIPDFVEKPTVIVIQSGSTKIGDDLIALLMNDIYTYVVRTGKDNKTKKLPRNIHCFLDEFANCNIADGPEYIKMLTTSRKFGMFWHMILQCDAQLDRKYDANIGRIIRANSTEIFMGSHDYETEVRFAKSCGQKTIESLASVIAQQDPRLEVVDLITPEQLNLTKEGYVYIKSNRHPLTKTYIEAFYNCDEFVSVENIDMVYPHNRFDYQQTSFYPDDLPPELSSSEFEVLSYLMDGKKSLQAVIERFPGLDVKKIIRSLFQKDAVELLDDQMIKSYITQRQYGLYVFREQNGFHSTSASLAPAPAHSNPFSFDYDSDDSEDSDEYDNWLCDGSTEDASEEDDDNKTTDIPMFTELQEHVKDVNVDDILKKIENLTIVPEFLVEVIKYYMLTDEEKEKSELIFPRNPNILKFEIIEVYLKNNDFATKDEWVNKIQEEFDYLKAECIFSKLINDQYINAIEEIDNELTLMNIREIKKLISDNL